MRQPELRAFERRAPSGNRIRFVLHAESNRQRLVGADFADVDCASDWQAGVVGRRCLHRNA